MRKVHWYEVWIESLSDSNFLYLLLLQYVDDSLFEIVDLMDNSEVIEVFSEYDEAVHWLCEDEYELVEGRWIPFRSGRKDLEFVSWIEVWIKIDSTNVLCVRVVRFLSDGNLEMFNPKDKKVIVKKYDKYEDLKALLEKDYFQLIKGRWESSYSLKL